MIKKIFLFLLLFTSSFSVMADEGMWIPMLLNKYNIADMQKAGFKLTADDIYSINHSSLKDAIVGLGYEGQPFFHFCTGEIVSDKGLIITNHHCSFDLIQKHSSLTNNYLRNGFYASTYSEELTNPGITASILVKIDDVTSKVLDGVKDSMSEVERNKIIDNNIKKIIASNVTDKNYKADIQPYFNGNQYFLSVFKIYGDVRLVAAPPSAIGKFGGDTDNWMWPRHTGDFSLLRIYAGENNSPASYAPTNKPFIPQKSLKISIKGINEGDFTMVFGYPGSTREYITSYAVDQIVNLENPTKVNIRTAKLDIINAAMNSNEALRLKYASKAAGIANAWKKWQGESLGVANMGTIKTKQDLERRFILWSHGKPEYNGIIDSIRLLYDKRAPLIKAYSYLTEAGTNGAEVLSFAASFIKLIKSNTLKINDDTKKDILKASTSFFDDYDYNTDCALYSKMLQLYSENMSSDWTPDIVKKAKGSGNFDKFAQNSYKKSVFTDKTSFESLVNSLTGNSIKKLIQKLMKDPILVAYNSFADFKNQRCLNELRLIEKQLQPFNRKWMDAQMKMQPEKTFWPDANSTLRVAYGKISSYNPKDGVKFKPYTTLKGIMEKDNPNIYDYDVPQKLRDAYKKGDWGDYAQDGEIHVCFIATNHTTGGNSGSPVLNANGDLIGINFDRAWEGVMSDIQYNPQICRNIALDIRYALFVLDKVMGAENLIKELNLVK